jgi:hypothetical protein
MTLFCFFTRSEEVTSCFFGLNDKIATMTYNSSEKKITATQEFTYPDAQGSSLISLALSPDNLYLCGAYSNKTVVSWEVQTGAIAGQCVVHKKPTALLCSAMPGDPPSKSFALVSEKGGEVWAYPLPSLSKEVKVLGHTSSVITDMTLSPDGSRIVTADRDEKIRLTTFPETSTIAGYCLGHTDVVTSVAFVHPPAGAGSSEAESEAESLLVSSGWDHRVCLWSPRSCRQLDVLALGAPPAPQGEGGGEKQAEGEGEGEEDEAAADKVYDETKAGNFPLRIIAPPHDSSRGSFAVLFWNRPEISLFQVEAGREGRAQFARGEEGGDAAAAAAAAVLPLPAAPVDCVFVEGGRALLVLLPAPHYLQLHSLPPPLLSPPPAAAAAAREAEKSQWTAIAKHFSDIATQNGKE